ncbi:MAG: hypothetical protein QM635_09855 [Microbacteriaceae bacterium]
MYRALWSRLPGPRWLRATIVVLAAVLVAAVLMVWVFPLVDRALDDATVSP